MRTAANTGILLLISGVKSMNMSYYLQPSGLTLSAEKIQGVPPKPFMSDSTLTTSWLPNKMPGAVHVTACCSENLGLHHQPVLTDDFLGQTVDSRKGLQQNSVPLITHVPCYDYGRHTQYHSLQFDGWVMVQAHCQDSFTQSEPQSWRNLTEALSLLEYDTI